MASLKLDQWKGRWSFARGATKATHRSNGQSITELTEALAEVDGLLAGINYLEKVEPDSEEARPASAWTHPSDNYVPSKPATASWFGHLAGDLPQLDTSSPENLSKIEPKQLRSILTEKLVNSNGEPRQAPRESQWATIQSLRSASMLHYNKFAKVAADSTNADIRKLRRSYVTAKKLLEMGILTFRQVLHRQHPTTLVDIFAFASLSYVISKTLHAKGHIEDSDILSGLWDWREAIIDEKERSAFDEIAEKLWPEAKEIMHFIPLKRGTTNLENAALRHDENKSRDTLSLIREEATDQSSLMLDEGNITSRDGPPLSPWLHTDASDLQARTSALPCLSEVDNPPGILHEHVRQLTQETGSHPEFTFSDWLNFDYAVQEGSLDPNFYQNLVSDIGSEVLNSSQTGCVTEVELAPTDRARSPPHELEEPSPDEQAHPLADDSTANSLLDTALFQVVFCFMIQISETGDLLYVLSGGDKTSGKDKIKPSHSRPAWETSEFLEQVSEHFFRPLHNEAVQIDAVFSGIIAMAEMFVKLDSFQTVREVENYIITVSRTLARSYDLFATLVWKTLNQCLFASRIMGWDLLYPKCVQEDDSYSIPYIKKRQRDEEEWARFGFERRSLSTELSSPTSLTNDNPKKHSTVRPKRSLQDVPDSAAKRRRRENPGAASESSPSGSDASPKKYCPFENCSQYFTGTAAPSNLSRHIRTKHQKKKKSFKCPICFKETDRRDNLRQHFSKLHGNHTLPDWIANTRRGLQDARLLV